LIDISHFTVLYGMQTRFSDENSVCLSVCLSVCPSVCPSNAWIVTDLSSVLSQSTRLTDRRTAIRSYDCQGEINTHLLTYGQTDGRTDSFLINRSRLHSMQRGKNCKTA